MPSLFKKKKKLKQEEDNTLEGTGRLEAFSDGVIAIALTLLILELRVPEFKELTSAGAFGALVSIGPKLVGFFVSFFTIAIFWVNHHHFFHPIDKSDSALLWHNNHLLFWIVAIPFVTGFIGDHPTIPFVVALYGFVFFMGAVAFTLMTWHVFFRTELLHESVTLAIRKTEFKRSFIGVAVYGISVITAFIHPYISLAIFAILPFFYFIPSRIEVETHHSH